MMGKFIRRKFIFGFALLVLSAFICFSSVNKSHNFAFADHEKVYLGGYAAGFTINTRGAEIIGLTEVITESGVVSPAKDAGVEKGDILLSIGEKQTNCFEDIEKALQVYKNSETVVKLKRNGEEIVKCITPRLDLTGKYKLGLFVRDKLNGIGTITYIDTNNDFMALGHPICTENERLIEITGGDLFTCSVFGVVKGERGKAGELRGMFLSDKSVGSITENKLVGIRGKINDNFNKKTLRLVEIGKGQVGNAKIVTTIDGQNPQEYDIQIVKVDSNESKNRNFVIKVTDKNLLKISGGIVQGMSGSPILQNGKIIGAVTHVFINDPTRGYGIEIDKMLN